MELEELVSDAIKGDDGAFVSLMQACKTDLYKTAYAYLRNEADAIEAVQETTCRAYQSIQTLQHPEYAKTWLIRIMINVCQTELQKRKKVTVHPFLEDERSVDHQHSTIETTEALESLSPKERELIHLKYIQDLTIRQVAEVLEMPEGTVKTKLYQSLSRLKRWFEKGDDQHVSK
ncbi:sigma-70 family RNA polymerase sigma factor [Jeotgalibacillus terrae]|uniref:Sigma-70 family RNA polymerase sigma factor n=1 Tax=Jeotgalibacillus terrae TaxID=587735 RepID=A0ABW5ZIH3_9BACL|nr:sigma-70 family RNA polymerase sigma factor [Jeotgalibacillus terrae]MBM7580363.1 RNA polymerase sigma-70 factor (ECF subfamily) [Jeotgalibacillus terrae]